MIRTSILSRAKQTLSEIKRLATESLQNCRKKRKTLKLAFFEAFEDRDLLTVSPAWFTQLIPSTSSAVVSMSVGGSTVAVRESEFIVTLKPGSNLSGPAAAASTLAGFDNRLQVIGGTGSANQALVKFHGAAATGAAQLARSPHVANFEPNVIVRTAGFAPDDSLFASQWPLENTGQRGGLSGADIHATDAWRITTGSPDIVVAVIDTGVDRSHIDLAANVFRLNVEIPNGRDDDGNGFVDDQSGWDFVANTADVRDPNGHGTHVAGTIAAAGGNGIGVSGVSWNSKLLPVRFLDANGSGATADAIRSVNYVTGLKLTSVPNLRVINNSWGSGHRSQALEAAFSDAAAAGIISVAAAGNNGANADVTPMFPAAFPGNHIISVAASDRSDKLATFSNFGLNSVDLAAPGASILSTVPGNGYVSLSGTSMAAPHVAGALALALSRNPQLSIDAMRSSLLGSVDKIASLTGKVGSGRLNVHKLLLAVPPSGSLPAAPTSIAFPNVWKNSADVAWKDVSNETGFLVFVSTDNGKTFKLAAKLPANTTKLRLNGLTAGTRHTVQIVSFGARGNSTPLTGSFTTKA